MNHPNLRATLEFLASLRQSVLWLPLTAVAGLGALIIIQSSYSASSASLVRLGEKANARIQIQLFLRNLLEAETGQRGYLLTGRDEYLAPYRDGLVAIGKAQTWLLEHYDHDPIVEPQLLAIFIDSDRKLAELDATLAFHQAGQHNAWRELLLSDDDMQLMDRIRTKSLSLLALENQRVDSQRANMLETLRLSRLGLSTMVALSLLALVMFLRQSALLDNLTRRHAADLKAERDQLESEVANRTEELTHLAESLQTAREDERGHIARELHDELGALLTAAKLDAARLKRGLASMGNADLDDKLSSLTRTLNDGIGLKRRIIEDLRPSSLSNLGVKAAIEIMAADIAQRAHLVIDSDIDFFELDEATGITLYRMVQESITNVVKYAAATRVHVHIAHKDGQVTASVTDDGRGFDTNAVRGSAQGLVGMRYRVQARGGRLQVRSSLGQGTTITATLPLRSAAPAAASSLTSPQAAAPAPEAPHAQRLA